MKIFIHAPGGFVSFFFKNISSFECKWKTGPTWKWLGMW